MDEAVRHEHDKPVFYKRDLIFTHLVVDKVKIESFGDQLEYTVYYAATGKVIENYKTKVTLSVRALGET